MYTNQNSKILSDSTLRSRLSFPDGLRGIAAFWVVLFHMAEGHHIDKIKSVLPNFLYTPIFAWGDLGVAVFFVLSGFVMALTAYKVKFNWKNSALFITRRLIRIVPPYYFAIAVALFLIFIKATALHLEYIPPSVIDFISHLFFLQGLLDTPLFNTVFWTLYIEIQFYIIFAGLLWISDSLQVNFNLPRARILVILLACGIALLWPLNIVSTTFWGGSFVQHWYSFLAGVIVCWGWLDKSALLKQAVFYCLLIFVAGIFYKSGFMLAVALTAGGLLFASSRNMLSFWLSWPWLQFLALISYSLYLLHNPITGASFNITDKLFHNSLISEIIGLNVSLAVCVAISYISFLLIESPSIKWSHKVSLKK